MSVYTNVKFQQISMRDLESAVNVRELNQSTIIKTFDSVSVSFFLFCAQTSISFFMLEFLWDFKKHSNHVLRIKLRTPTFWKNNSVTWPQKRILKRGYELPLR